MATTNKSAKVNDEGEVQASPKPQITMVTLSVNSYNFNKLKQGTQIDAMLDASVEAFIGLGLLVPLTTYEVDADSVDTSKLTLDYQTRCQGCGG